MLENMLPIIGLTMGDPAGIGSEITAKVLAYDRLHEFCVPVVIGDVEVVRQGFEIIGQDPVSRSCTTWVAC